MNKNQKKNDTRFLMKMIHGLVDLTKLVETDKENIYYTNGQELFEELTWFNGYDYIPVNPLLAEMKDFPNKAYDEHRNRVKSMADKGNWVDVFEFIDKRVGLTVYLRDFEIIPDGQKYDAFIAIYQRSEFGFELLKDHYEKIFSFSHHSESRKERLKALEVEMNGRNTIKIYHGVSYDYPVFDYYSWTLNQMTAQFFAYRYSNFGEILEHEIFYNSAVDYLVNRNESEILYQPSDIFLKLVFHKGIEENVK